MVNNIVTQFEKSYKKKNIPDPRPGDIVKVYQLIKEGEKERIQVFEGVVIKRQHGTQLGASFTVRKIAVGGVGVEKTFPLHSPLIVKVERIKSSKVRRAHLGYLRNIKSSKIKLRKEKKDPMVWEEPEAEKELEKIKEEQEQEAQLKAQEKEKEEEELEEKFEQAQASHGEPKTDIKDEKSDQANR